MIKLPQVQSLTSQTAEILRDGIASGLWKGRLPGERALCKKYQVSRSTLRTALMQLNKEKLIQTVHGSNTRILSPSRQNRHPVRSLDVGLLSPDPIEHLRPTLALWIDELRALLSERGCRLRLFHGRQYFRGNPGGPLQRLITENPHGCWILTLSNAAIQHWFARMDVCCVVAGSVHAGLALPSRDIDHRAMCRHAAGVFLGLGHLKLALLAAQSQLAGALESEAGFVEGVKASPHLGAEAVVRYHDGSVAGIGVALRRLMEQKIPPTAILVGNTHHYLTVVGFLTQMGKRIPQDVSTISRDDDPFLSYVVPHPARYQVGAHTLAKALLQVVLDLLKGKTPPRPELRLMPEFTRGESLARMSGVGRDASAIASVSRS